MEKSIAKNKDVAVTKTAEHQVTTDVTSVSHDAKRKPVSTLRVDDCSASIWAREHLVKGQQKVFYSITIERSYKDRDGRWCYTRSFAPDSLGAISQLCQQASEAIAGMTKDVE